MPHIPAGRIQTVAASLDVAHPQRWDHRRGRISTRGQRRAGRSGTRAGPLRDAVRHPHHRVHQRQGLPAERAQHEAPRRLRAPPTWAPGHGREPPRHRAPAGNPEGDGLQRHPHQPQSALAGTAGALRPHGLRGHGRSLRQVEACPRCRNGYAKFFDEWSERDVRDMLHRDRNHPSVDHVEHRQRDSRAGRPRRRRDGQAPDRHLPPGRPHAPHDFGVQ